MEESILDTIKHLLGIDKSFTEFDQDILVQINSAFFHLNQLGVGPDEGFVVESNVPMWTDYIGSDPTQFHAVKSFIYSSVRLSFDPPATSFGIEALEKQKREWEWRLNVQAEGQ